MVTTLMVVPGNWASVKGGKWHILPGPYREDEIRDAILQGRPVTSKCGTRFVPLNVTGGGAPPTNDHWICVKCVK